MKLKVLLILLFSLNTLSTSSLARSKEIAPLESSFNSQVCSQYFRTVIWTKKKKEIASQIIFSGSSNVSRTISKGRRFIAPETVVDSDISKIAEMNFELAVKFIIENLDDLEINKETARELNKILTNKLVADNIRGDLSFRTGGSYVYLSDSFVSGNPETFYEWLESDSAIQLFKSDPVSFAEKIHHNLVALDSFPDGNGRLSRLFSDFALMKAGYAPALYSNMVDYFKRGNARSEVTRQDKAKYYYEIVEKGQKMMKSYYDGSTMIGY